MSYILPLMILGLIIYALIKRVDVYSAFTEGAAEALPMLIRILPYMAGMLAAIQALRASGALEWLLGAFSPLFNAVGLPAELAPLFILRPFSGSAALSLLGDVLTTYGPDTFTGVAASIMLGSTETIFYTIALYFGTVGIRRTRAALPAALISSVIGTAAAIVLAQGLFA